VDNLPIIFSLNEASAKTNKQKNISIIIIDNWTLHLPKTTGL